MKTINTTWQRVSEPRRVQASLLFLRQKAENRPVSNEHVNRKERQKPPWEEPGKAEGDGTKNCVEESLSGTKPNGNWVRGGGVNVSTTKRGVEKASCRVTG